MMVKTIVFDLDDCVSDLSTPLLTALNKATGKNLTKKDWSTYYIDQLYGMSFDDVLEIMVKERVLENSKPLPGAKEALDRAVLDHNVYVVTARAWHPNGLELTENWFDEHQMQYGKLRLAGLHQSKLELLSHMDEIDLAIDDRGSTCVDYMKSGKVKKILMVNQPWNASLADIHRIADISEAGLHF